MSEYCVGQPYWSKPGNAFLTLLFFKTHNSPSQGRKVEKKKLNFRITRISARMFRFRAASSVRTAASSSGWSRKLLGPEAQTPLCCYVIPMVMHKNKRAVERMLHTSSIDWQGQRWGIKISSEKSKECPFPNRNFTRRMAEVGKLEPIKIDGNYSGGQLFLHRLFGYRGVILFPWSARVYDRDKSAKTAEPSNTTTPQGYQPPTQAPPGTVWCHFTH